MFSVSQEPEFDTNDLNVKFVLKSQENETERSGCWKEWGVDVVDWGVLNKHVSSSLCPFIYSYGTQWPAFDMRTVIVE